MCLEGCNGGRRELIDEKSRNISFKDIWIFVKLNGRIEG